MKTLKKAAQSKIGIMRNFVHIIMYKELAILQKPAEMKKLLLILFVIASIAKQSHAQVNVYHPFPGSNSFWNEQSYSLNWNHTCATQDYYTLFINGDTIIGAKSYHKIYKNGYTVYSCQNPPTTPIYTYYNTYYRFAIRQDSLQKKVFLYDATSNKDTLLYDFNLNVGDTLHILNSNYGIHYVTSIDSVLVGAKYHKEFLLETSLALIEGVGCTCGLNTLIGIFPDGGGTLNCFNHNSETYPANASCSLTIDVNETIVQKIQIQVSPNPFSSSTTLQSYKPFTNATFILYNAFGQEVRSMVISHSPFVIERSDLPSGLYFIRLVQDNKIVATDKLIITNN